MIELYDGRPVNTSGRAKKETAVYDLLDSLGIKYKRADHEAAYTMEACAEIDRLFLCNSQKTRFYLLMIREDKKFRTKEISAQIGSPRLSFAPEEYMKENRDITPGSVSVMGLMNDTENCVQLLIDEDILASELVGCHPCVNTSSLSFRVRDLIDVFLPAVGHSYITVRLSEEA